MKQAYVFDVDGTITPSRQSISKKIDNTRHQFEYSKGLSFQEFFLSFCKTNDVFLVTDSDYKKTREQLGDDICDSIIHIVESCKDKRQILPLLEEYDEVHFFGDKMWEGGNDFSLGAEIKSQDRGQIYAVNNWRHTYWLLERVQYKKVNRRDSIDVVNIDLPDDKTNTNRHSGAWCPIPFNAISLNPNGSLTRCMMSNSPMTKQSDYASWDNSRFRNLRTNMLAGTWDQKGCKSCWDKEKAGISSQRQNWLNNHIDEFPSDAYDNPSVTDNPIRHLFLNFGNICNFKCRMCSPNFSNALLPEFNHMQELNISRQYSESFGFNQTTQFKNINSAIDFLDYYHDRLGDLRTIWVTGGEPLIDNTLYDVCDVLTSFGNPEEIAIVITTNGSKLDIDKLAQLSHFRSIAIDISLDATGDRFEYMRSNGLVTWDQISKTVLDVYEFKKNNPWLIMSLNASYQLYNADNIYDFIKFAAPISDMNLRVLTGPRYYQLAHASDNLKNEMRHQITRALDDFSSILTDRHRGRLADINKMLDRDRNEEYWQEFVQVTNSVDEYRKMYIRDYIPKLSKEIEQTVHSPLQLHTKYLTK